MMPLAAAWYCEGMRAFFSAFASCTYLFQAMGMGPGGGGRGALKFGFGMDVLLGIWSGPITCQFSKKKVAHSYRSA